MPRKRPPGFKLPPISNSVSILADSYKDLSLGSPDLLFSNIDAMPTNTQETVLRAAFEKLLEQYKITHSDIINNPEYSSEYERFFKLLETVRDKLFSNTESGLELEGAESLKNTYNNTGNVDQGRRLKLEKKYVSPQNSHSKLHSDEALVMFDVQVYKFGKIVKKIITPRNVGTYEKEQTYFTLFKAIFEITMQLLASEIVKSDEAIRALNVTVPKITDYYLIINGEDMKIVIEMEYIENEPLKDEEQLLRAHDALTILREKYKIFHNDSHKDNIRRIHDSDRIVLFDWDVSTIGPSKTQQFSPSGISFKREIINKKYFDNWITMKLLPIDSMGHTLGGKSRKHKKLKKTKKMKKSKKSKKTKKIKKSKKTKKIKKK
jgi:hypothetical protein